MSTILARLKNGSMGEGDEIQLSGAYKHLAGKSFTELSNETTTTTIDEDIPVIVSQLVLETAVAKRVIRKIVPTDSTLVNAPGSTLRYPRENTITFASQTEAAVSITATAVDTGDGVTADPVLYMARVDITYESLEDGLHSWMERIGKMFGRDAAVYEDKLAIGTFYAGATGAHITDKSDDGWDAASGKYQNLKDDILGSMEFIEVDKYAPSHLLLNTVLSKYVRDHPDFSDYSVANQAVHTAGRTDMREGGIIGSLYSMEVVTTPNVYESTSYSNADTYLILDNEFAANMVDKRPFMLKQHDMPELDENWLIGSFRVAPTVLQPNALSGKTDCLSP